MNRKSFLTTALLPFAALLMPRKAQALTEEPTPKVAWYDESELSPAKAKAMRDDWNAWAASPEGIKSLGANDAAAPEALLVCATTTLDPTIGPIPGVSRHYDWFWAGSADGVAHCDSVFLTGPIATLPPCLSPCPSHIEGHCGFMLTQEVLAFAAPDERRVVFPDDDHIETPVYFLGSWIHAGDDPPRWVAP